MPDLVIISSRWLSTIAAILCVEIACEASANQYPYFEPTPGPSAKIMVGEGTLLGWGRGNAEGGIGIRKADGSSLDLILGRNPTINGQVIDCFRAPDDGDVRDPAWCGAWPPGLNVGSTRVLYFYWMQKTPSGLQTIVATNRLLFGAALEGYKSRHLKRRNSSAIGENLR